MTSPPYWGLRDYGVDGQLGLEGTPEEYVSQIVGVFRDVRRVLKSSGTLWLNLGDSYVSGSGAQVPDSKTNHATVRRPGNPGKNGGVSNLDGQGVIGLAPKNLVGIPWRVAFALQADGWWLRSDIIWAKPNPMPESVTDRPTKAHEYLFLMAKSERYWYDAEAVKERASEESGWAKQRARGENTWEYNDTPERIAGTGQRIESSTFGTAGSRNARTVWTIPTTPYLEAHFATFPRELARRCILAGCPRGGTVLDPFAGSGTVGEVAEALGRDSILIELNSKYCDMARSRTSQNGLLHEAH